MVKTRSFFVTAAFATVALYGCDTTPESASDTGTVAAAAVTVADRGADADAIRQLDETCTEQAALEPDAFRAVSGASHQVVNGELTVHLLPYAIARIDAIDAR